MTPYEIQEQMAQVLRTLDDLVEATRVAGVDLAEKERRDKVKFAKTRMEARSSGRKLTVDAINDIATVATEEEAFDHQIAEQTVKYTREALRAAETRLDVLRSMGAAIRGAGG